MLFNLVDFRFIIQKGWITLRGVDFGFLRYFVYAHVYSSPCLVEESSLTLIRFCILWEGPLTLFLNFY